MFRLCYFVLRIWLSYWPCGASSISGVGFDMRLSAVSNTVAASLPYRAYRAYSSPVSRTLCSRNHARHGHPILRAATYLGILILPFSSLLGAISLFIKKLRLLILTCERLYSVLQSELRLPTVALLDHQAISTSHHIQGCEASGHRLHKFSRVSDLQISDQQYWSQHLRYGTCVNKKGTSNACNFTLRCWTSFG